MALLGVEGVLEMIVSHRDPSSLNMSSYRAIWTHFRSNSMILMNLILQTILSELQFAGIMDAQPSRRRKIWCQETLGHLSQGTGWYLASCAVLCWGTAAGGGCPSTALHSHEQLAKYHLVPWLRWPNVSWHQIFCYWGYSRWAPGFTIGSWIQGFLDSRWVLKESSRSP